MKAYRDFRCIECGHITYIRTEHDVDLVECEECGGISEKIWLSAPGVLMRPDGWNLRPDEPGYSKLPKTDREIYRWQSSNKKNR